MLLPPISSCSISTPSGVNTFVKFLRAPASVRRWSGSYTTGDPRMRQRSREFYFIIRAKVAITICACSR